MTALVLLLLSPALAWNRHDLVTDAAIKGAPWVETPVVVEPMETFLSADAAALKTVFEGYYAWLTEHGSTRFHPMAFDPAQPTVAMFVHAARLNPATAFTSGGAVPGTTQTARQVLDRFADEPDGGMDNELFGIPAYGYGVQPYGKPTGDSSDAPFHMLFAHENFIVRNFARPITEGMTTERIALDVRLARLAFQSGHPYWGYRFTAWAAHYIQDLAQPYHSRAVPGRGTMWYVGYVFSPCKKQVEARTTQVETNRHYLYEDYIGLAMASDLVPSEQKLVASLGGDTTYPDAASVPALVERVGRVAADGAKETDSAISAAFGPRLTDDWRYEVDTDPSFDASTAIAAVPAEAGEALVARAVLDLQNAGRATRTVLGFAGVGAQP